VGQRLGCWSERDLTVTGGAGGPYAHGEEETGEKPEPHAGVLRVHDQGNEAEDESQSLKEGRANISTG